MPIYFVCKRRGLWSVRANDSLILEFNGYDEAINTAQAAASVMLASGHKPGARSAASVFISVHPHGMVIPANSPVDH